MNRRPPEVLPGSRASFAPGAGAEAAEDWFVRQASGALAPAEQERFAAWLAADPAHARAYREVERLWADLGPAMEPCGATGKGAAAPRPRRAGTTRRRVLAAGLAGGGGLIAAGIAGGSWFAGPSLRAPRGETLHLSLSRGLGLTLASGSEMQTTPAQGAAPVGIRLLRGAALVEVGGQIGGQFPGAELRVGAIALRAGAGRIALQCWTDQAQATCLSGAPELLEAASAGGRRLAVGETTTCDDGARPEIRPARLADSAWLEGRIICENTPLHRLVEDLDRNRAGRLLLDPAVRDLRVTGSFRTDAAEEAVVALTRILPLRRIDLGPWLTVLRRA